MAEIDMQYSSLVSTFMGTPEFSGILLALIGLNISSTNKYRKHKSSMLICVLPIDIK